LPSIPAAEPTKNAVSPRRGPGSMSMVTHNLEFAISNAHGFRPAPE
jgi:hypothetical protein